MTRRLPLSLVILAAGVALLVAAGLAQPATRMDTTEAPRGGTLRVGSFTDVDFVDPALAYSADSWLLLYATCAKLFNYPDAPDAAGARVVPEVVDRYHVSKDGRTYTFDLRRTFRFHTGARVTAQSFVDAFNRVAQPQLRSPAASYLHEIVGADAVLDGMQRTISGVRALGPYGLRIRLTRPVGDLTARLTMPFFCPILPGTPIDPAGIDNPPGSGPYYVAERIVNQRIVLRRNPYYRGSRPARVDRIVHTVGETSETCAAAAEEDRIDFCFFGPSPAIYRTLAEKHGINRPGGQFFVRPSMSTVYVVFNHARPAFKGSGQIPLEKAINYAIDRPEFVRGLGYLAGKRTDRILPPALARPARVYPLEGADPTTARVWLERARFKPAKLVVYAANAPPSVAMNQVLVYNLRQLGIEVEVRYFDPGTLVARAATPGEPFDLLLWRFNADYADGAGFLVPLLAVGGVNRSDPGLQRRIDAASQLTGEARRRAWADLDLDLMRDDPPWAPIMHPNERVFVSRSIGCIVVHPLYGFDVATACKKR